MGRVYVEERAGVELEEEKKDFVKEVEQLVIWHAILWTKEFTSMRKISV